MEDLKTQIEKWEGKFVKLKDEEISWQQVDDFVNLVMEKDFERSFDMSEGE